MISRVRIEYHILRVLSYPPVRGKEDDQDRDSLALLSDLVFLIEIFSSWYFWGLLLLFLHVALSWGCILRFSLSRYHLFSFFLDFASSFSFFLMPCIVQLLAAFFNSSLIPLCLPLRCIIFDSSVCRYPSPLIIEH